MDIRRLMVHRSEKRIESGPPQFGRVWNIQCRRHRFIGFFPRISFFLLSTERGKKICAFTLSSCNGNVVDLYVPLCAMSNAHMRCILYILHCTEIDVVVYYTVHMYFSPHAAFALLIGEANKRRHFLLFSLTWLAKAIRVTPIYHAKAAACDRNPTNNIILKLKPSLFSPF